MGFLDYAWSISLQKDQTKARICINIKCNEPTLKTDLNGYQITLPIPSFTERETISYLGSEFSKDAKGKAQALRLFRASVFHLSAHTLIPLYEKNLQFNDQKSILSRFVDVLVKDAYVNAIIPKLSQIALSDISFANSLAYGKALRLEQIKNPSTRIMSSILLKTNCGKIKGKFQEHEEKLTFQIVERLNALKKEFSLKEITFDPSSLLLESKKEIVRMFSAYGPFIDLPSLPYTERIGSSHLFLRTFIFCENEIECVNQEDLSSQGTEYPKVVDDVNQQGLSSVTAIQVFDTWFQQKEKEERMLQKLLSQIESTKLKSISFPDEDFARYLKARQLISGGSRRLIDSLRIAADALDEDPGKEIGQLDLSAVIQVVASRKPATDVFMQDEYLSKSFAWAILFDASASMGIRGEFGRALAICLGETAKELMMDNQSWSFFAFSDRFYVLKDSSEGYSRKTKSRIGGLKFEGLTYIPDAIKVAGSILAKRFEEQRFLVVISDGYPYGYPGIEKALKEVILSLQKKGVIVIGIGLETDKTKDFFKLSASPIYNQKDVIKKFGKIYMMASAAALET
jgi:hypothetical protein